jgi:hypothetical protein
VEYHVSEAGAQAVLAEMQLPRLRLLLQSSTLLGAVVTAAFAMLVSDSDGDLIRIRLRKG